MRRLCEFTHNENENVVLILPQEHWQCQFRQCCCNGLFFPSLSDSSIVFASFCLFLHIINLRPFLYDGLVIGLNLHIHTHTHSTAHNHSNSACKTPCLVHVQSTLWHFTIETRASRAHTQIGYLQKVSKLSHANLGPKPQQNRNEEINTHTLTIFFRQFSFIQPLIWSS